MFNQNVFGCFSCFSIVFQCFQTRLLCAQKFPRWLKTEIPILSTSGTRTDGGFKLFEKFARFSTQRACFFYFSITLTFLRFIIYTCIFFSIDHSYHPVQAALELKTKVCNKRTIVAEMRWKIYEGECYGWRGSEGVRLLDVCFSWWSLN